MKKTFALFLATLIVLCLSAPLIALADTPATDPPDTSQAVTVEPTTAPMVATATTDAQETDPGGIDLTQLLQALVGVLALVITRYMVPWLQAHIATEKLARLDYWYRVAVSAAEKAYGSGRGAEKLTDATQYLKSKGIIIDDKIVDALIKELFEGTKKSGPTP